MSWTACIVIPIITWILVRLLGEYIDSLYRKDPKFKMSNAGKILVKIFYGCCIILNIFCVCEIVANIFRGG